MTTLLEHLSPYALGALRACFRGALLRPGEEGYDEARHVWNGAIDRHPALIARCAGADDVARAVRVAREQDLPISVRGGGHSVMGYGVCDGGVTIDLSLMKSVQIDPAARVGRAAGGVLLSEFDLATQRHALATPLGTVGHVGLAGLTLHGGFGYLMRRYGLTVDNLRAVELVTAEGETLRVDAEHEPELFWGLRGGGGNFGVATALEYDLHPVGPLVLGGPVFWPLEQAPEVLRALRAFAPNAPDDLGIMLVARRAPPMPFLPPEHYGTPIFGLVLVWAGEVKEGMRAVEPLTSVGKPLANVVRPVPYLALQSLLDGSAPHGNGSFWKSHRLPALSDDVIEVIVSSTQAITSPHSLVSGWVMGGAVSRVSPDATAIGERESGFELRHIAVWPPDDPESERHIAWVQRGWEALRPHSAGRQLATMLADEGAAGVQAAYRDNLGRLIALKDRYDPENVFRLNANIVPSGKKGSKEMDKILVTGATGTVGSQVVRELRARGVSVRAFVRDTAKAAAMFGSGVELCPGDFGDAASVQRALVGVESVFLACGNVPHQLEYEKSVIDAAVAAGVKRLVKLSVSGAEVGSPVAYWDWHAQIERHLHASGLPAVTLHPTFYMTNVLAAADGVRHTGTLFAPAAGARIAMTDPRDVAAVAARVLRGAANAGQTLVLTGPEAVTYHDVVKALSSVTGKHVTFVSLPDAAAQHALIEAGLPEFAAEQIVRVFGQLRQGIYRQPTDTVRAVTGLEPRSFERFAAEHAALFQPAASTAASTPEPQGSSPR